MLSSICVGPRMGRFETESSTQSSMQDFGAHSIPFIVLGTFCLWFGWYGFNPGSTLSMKTKADAHTAGLVATNTTLAPCVGGLVVFLLRAKVLSPKLLDVGGFCNGILAGLVSITAGCAFVKPWEAIIIGLLGGVIYQGSSMLLQKLKIDDVVDAWSVHGACGIWGVLALGLFGNPDEDMGGNGLLYGGDQLRVQVMGVAVIVAWTGALSLVIFAPLRKLGMLRLADDVQEKGADFMEHSPISAYKQGACFPAASPEGLNGFASTAIPEATKAKVATSPMRPSLASTATPESIPSKLALEKDSNSTPEPIATEV